jgi:hypothetical protein
MSKRKYDEINTKLPQNIHEPNWYDQLYEVSLVDKSNMIILDKETIQTMYDSGIDKQMICQVHGCNHVVDVGRFDECCKRFLKYDKTFGYNNGDKIFIIPPPNIWNSKNTNYFRNMVFCQPKRDKNESFNKKIDYDKNTISIGQDEIALLYKNGINKCTLCDNHGCMLEDFGTKDKLNLCCVKFQDYSRPIILTSDNDQYAMQPPSTWSVQNLKNFKQVLSTIMSSYNEIILYKNFIQHEFKFGTIGVMKSGKYSVVRNHSLACRSPYSLRLTLTINSHIGPDEILVPSHIYRNDLYTNLVIINRAPSISINCMKILRMSPHYNEGDYTVHVNAFIIDGLHADQDGDTLTIFFFPKNVFNEYTYRKIYNELVSQTWEYGNRLDLLGHSRYGWSLHHKFVMFLNDEILKKKSAIWAGLSRKHPLTNEVLSFKERARMAMTIASSPTTNRKLSDELIAAVCCIVKDHGTQQPTWKDLLFGSGILESVVKSGAKGTPDHLEMYRTGIENVDNIDYSDFKSKTIDNYNKYINAKKNIQSIGTGSFITLTTMSSVEMIDNKIKQNDTLLMSDVGSDGLFVSMSYEHDVIKYGIKKTIEMLITRNVI